tara:strand:- start:141 stop:467 length:327 start_codon:yes stop_codon:yes gene_type:complete
MADTPFKALIVLGNGDSVPMSSTDVTSSFFSNDITTESNFVIDRTTLLEDILLSAAGVTNAKLHLYKGSRDTGIYWRGAALVETLAKDRMIPRQIRLTPGTYYIKNEV